VVAAALTGKPIVLEVNSPLAFEMASEKEIRARRFVGWIERMICNGATAVAVVSGPLRRIMIRSGVEQSKLFVLPNGVSRDHLATIPSSYLRESLGVGKRTVIGFVGWFRPWHGLELLLDAFSKSGLSGGGAVLLLVGDGPAMPRLREYIAGNRLQDAVIFTGPVPHEQISSYLDLIDIAVQPAANEYCCPMKILEYMGLAKAIIAPRQENIEELVEDGRTALLFTPGNSESLSQALNNFCVHPELRLELGTNAARDIHERGLLWESNAARIAGMFQSGFPLKEHPADIKTKSRSKPPL
jgi:glycosyltransferase involved in cell wall biosynthesis